MVFVKICVGSACHLKGSEELVELIKKEINQRRLEDEIILSAGFCCGKCNNTGVTVEVDDDIYTEITRERWHEFIEDKILSKAEK